MTKKRSRGDDDERPREKTPAPAETPFVLTLRDVEAPPPPQEQAQPAGDGLVQSDAEARQAPWLGDPEAERAAQRAARRAQVRKDRLRDTTPEVDVALPPPAPDDVAPSQPAAPAPTLPPLPPLPELDTDASANVAPRADTTPVQNAPPAATRASPPASAPPTSAPAKAPAILLLRASSAEADPLGDQLRAFGFDVQVRPDLPDLPAPWPFVAVFIDHALHPADGGDAIDLCNEVRERSRLPGVLKPVLVLVADQLSATNRVRAGLAGCNEFLLGAITRGAVAKVLDTRGIALPSDARRT